MTKREEIIQSYEKELEETRVFGPQEVAKAYEEMLDLLRSDVRASEIYSEHKFEWYNHPRYIAKLWQDFIQNDVLEIEGEEE